MADYIGIKGGKVQNFSTNPPVPIAGQVWYNETTATINYLASNPAGTWASGGNLNDARAHLAGSGNGTQTATIVFGGAYDRTDNTESYDGTSWTEVNNLNASRYGHAGAGTATAALCFGGHNEATPADLDVNEIWNGTNWTEVADLNTVKRYAGGNGTSTSALAVGGYDGTSNLANVETWNGTAWTEGDSLNTARAYDLAAFGTSTSAIHAGGDSGPGNRALSEEWDGSSWTEVGDLSTAIRYTVGGGTTSAGIQAGGLDSNDSVVTQEWTQASAAVTFTSS